MKRLFKKKEENNQPPREYKAIQKEYQELCYRAGELQYVVAANTIELNALNDKLLKVNQEAAERVKLDKKAAEATAQPANEKKAE